MLHQRLHEQNELIFLQYKYREIYCVWCINQLLDYIKHLGLKDPYLF